MGNVIKKVVIGLIVGGALFGITRALEFPPVFQWMFFAYALLGTAVFVLLDAPSQAGRRGQSPWRARSVLHCALRRLHRRGVSLAAVRSGRRKGKIEKILKPKRAATEQGKAEELLARAKALDEQAKALAARIKALGGDQAPGAQAAGGAGTPPSTTGAAGGDLLKIGEDQWQLQECYNCHKLRGEGGKNAVRSSTISAIS